MMCCTNPWAYEMKYREIKPLRYPFETLSRHYDIIWQSVCAAPHAVKHSYYLKAVAAWRSNLMDRFLFLYTLQGFYISEAFNSE